MPSETGSRAARLDIRLSCTLTPLMVACVTAHVVSASIREISGSAPRTIPQLVLVQVIRVPRFTLCLLQALIRPFTRPLTGNFRSTRDDRLWPVSEVRRTSAPLLREPALGQDPRLREMLAGR